MQKPTMAFIRRFDGRLPGGHLKVFDYARHVAASNLYQPVLYVTPESTHLDDAVVGFEIPRISSLREADAYFVAGLDWRVMIANGVDARKQPVVNLIQGFAHTREGDLRRSFLAFPALRICVSSALCDAVVATGLANGPVACIENATDVALHETRAGEPTIFIAGMKSPALAAELAIALRERGMSVDIETDSIPRDAFLARLRAATIAVLLPVEHDGFFLPALEAMALGCAVVVPRIEGARSYCINGETASVTDYTLTALIEATVHLYEDASERERLSHNGLQRAALHSPQRERDEFLRLLAAYAEDWQRIGA